MKIVKTLIFIIIAYVFFVPNIYGYENNFFDIKIPKNYKTNVSQEGTYQWVNKKKKSNFVVSINLRTNKTSLFKYNDEKKEQYISNVISSMEEQYYYMYKKEIPLNLLYQKETKFGSYNSLFLKLQIENMLNSNINMNQFIYIIESKNYIYNVVYTTPEKEYDKSVITELQKSFIINDKSKNNNIFEIVIKTSIFIFGFISAFVYKYLIKSIKKHEK